MIDVSLRDTIGDDAHAGAHSETLPPPHRTGGWRRPLTIIALAILALAAIGLVIGKVINDYRDAVTRAGLTADTTPLAITIAGTPLTLPANMVRFPATRKASAVDRIDLLLHWPELHGFTEALADDFRSNSPAAPLIFVSISARSVPLNTDERLAAVYARYLTGPAVAGPSGLVGRRLSDDSGYRGEIVFFTPTGITAFAARCLADATPEMPSTCMRDVDIGHGLSMLYRFDRSLLGQWESLDLRLRQLAATFFKP